LERERFIVVKTNRLEAFSDGVIAILITIMVLELKVPHEPTLAAMRPVGLQLLSYALSFIYLGIYWNNHHHLLHVAHRVSGGVLWANLHLLFWLSLIPFTTAWLDESHLAALPAALYGAVLLMSALAYSILVRALIGVHGRDSLLARAIGDDRKGWISVALYVAGMALSFWRPWAGALAYVVVAMMWLIPDRRIENTIHHEERLNRTTEPALAPQSNGEGGHR
jgi:uncharacterized membrane protein